MIFTSGIIFTGLTTPPPAAGTVLNANMGLSKDLATGTIAQLGQTVGRAGDPAAITEDREIPDQGHRLFFGKNDGVSNVIGFSTSLGVFVANNTGFSFSAFWNFGGHSTVFQILTNDAQDTDISFGSGVAKISWNRQGSTETINKFLVDGAPWIMGAGEGVRITAVTGVAVHNVAATESVITVDSTAGNVQVNLDPAVIGSQRITVKKISSDANTITIHPTSGTIQELGAPAATFVFNSQGQSVTIVNDQTNFFII